LAVHHEENGAFNCADATRFSSIQVKWGFPKKWQLKRPFNGIKKTPTTEAGGIDQGAEARR